MDQLSLILSSIEETGKKVKSTVSQSIDNHIDNEKFDHKKDSLDFLEAKNSIMLSYMIELTQLLRLRTSKEKSPEEAEKCLNRLREMRIILEKVRPLEKKMRYQLDKLLALSASSSSFAAAMDNTPEESNTDEVMKSDVAVESDPLAFRPNPDLLDGKDDGDYSDDDDESTESNDDDSGEDDEDLIAAKMAFKADPRKDDKDSQLYKAPRLAAVPFTESKTQSEKEERLLKRQQDRMRKSELLSTLKTTFGDAPEEDDFGGGAVLGKQRENAQRLVEREAEKTRYEEETMIRLGTSRKEKKMKNRIMREEISNLNSISDLGNLASGVSVAFGDNKKGKSKGMDKDSLRFEGIASSRYSNGKRRRDFDEFGGDSSATKGGKRREPKNSLQKALYGVGASGSKKKSRK